MNRLGLFLVVAVVAACNNSPTAQLGPVAYVSIFPATKVVQVGATFPLSPTLMDANNNALSGRVITWSSNTPAVATVDNTTGIVMGVATGSAIITATSEGKTGTSVITVPGPATITICMSRPVMAGTVTIRIPLRRPRHPATSSQAGMRKIRPLFWAKCSGFT